MKESCLRLLFLKGANMNLFKKLFLKHCIVNPTGDIKEIGENNIAIVQKSVDEKYYYRTRVTCNNCGELLDLFIKKGLYVKYEVSNIRCTNCGCKIDREIK